MEASKSDSSDKTQNTGLLKRIDALEERIKEEEALERIRERALGMQHSDELHAVVGSIYQGLDELGFAPEICTIALIDTTLQTILIWSAQRTESGLSTYNQEVPPFDHPFMNQLLDEFESGEPYMVYELAGEDKKRFDEHMFRYTAGSLETDVEDALQAIDATVASTTFMSHGTVTVWRPVPLDERETAVMHRFARVIDLTYTRFADLQKAEAQNEELRNALNDLQSAQAQLIQAEKMASLGQLTAGIAHEIKNPLNFVNNFAQINAELLDDLKNDPDVRIGDLMDTIEDLQFNAARIREHGQRADRIVRSMMEHARGGTGKRERVDINAMVEEYVKLAYHGMQAQHAEFNVTILRDYSENAGAVEMQVQEIGRVLINLFSNAFDALREKEETNATDFEPFLRIETARGNRYIEIRVIDNGVGIPKNARDKIFEPFYTTKPAGQGIGLGLSLSFDIVTKGHNGALHVESEPGHGTTFALSLPL